jgi:hypothetical protein
VVAAWDPLLTNLEVAELLPEQREAPAGGPEGCAIS